MPSLLTVNDLEKNSLGLRTVGSEIVRCGKNEKNKVAIPTSVVGSPLLFKMAFRHCPLSLFADSGFGVRGPDGDCSSRTTVSVEFGACICCALAADLPNRRRCLLFVT